MWLKPFTGGNFATILMYDELLLVHALQKLADRNREVVHCIVLDNLNTAGRQ
jgi:hypothetical protein